MSEIVLTGLRADNPLAFLAALGTLRVLTLAKPDDPPRMGWTMHGGAWRPVVEWHVGSDDELLEKLEKVLQLNPEDHPITVWAVARKNRQKARRPKGSSDSPKARESSVAPSSDSDDWTQRISDETWAASSKSRTSVDVWAALQVTIGPSEGAYVSPLVLVRSDYLPGNIACIIRETDRESLHRALFQPWDYADPLENRSLRLDPMDDRRHALQWHAPTSDPARKKRGNMLAANRLAIEAFAYFVGVPKRAKVHFVGAHRNGTQGLVRIRWPIWVPRVGCATVSSLLTHSRLGNASDSDARDELRAMGVVAVYESQRVEVGRTNKKFNLSPARALE